MDEFDFASRDYALLVLELILNLEPWGMGQLMKGVDMSLPFFGLFVVVLVIYSCDNLKILEEEC